MPKAVSTPLLANCAKLFARPLQVPGQERVWVSPVMGRQGHQWPALAALGDWTFPPTGLRAPLKIPRRVGDVIETQRPDQRSAAC
jgi:hypothetical protein